MQDKDKLKQRLLLAIENSKGFGLQVGVCQILSLDIQSQLFRMIAACSELTTPAAALQLTDH